MGALSPTVELQPVGPDTWRDVAALEVTEAQWRFVARPLHYLALSAYGGEWRSLAVRADGRVVGHLMWAVDDEDGSCWLGGVLIDHRAQGRGLGRAAVRAALALLSDEHGHRSFALSYQPENEHAAALYASLGFELTGERDDDEVVARLDLDRA